MTARATVEDLDGELAAQAAAGHAALAAQQEAYVALEAAAADRERSLLARIAALEGDVKGAREELGRARAELQWLRRAGIDLNAVMDHRAVRTARAAGRMARRAGGGRPPSGS